MSVYVITGISKGIGFEFLKQLSADENNIVVGLVRDKVGTEKKVAEELGNCPNVHIVYTDLTEYASLKQAAADTANILGDHGIDYLVANGALVSLCLTSIRPSVHCNKVEELENVSSQLWKTNIVGNIHLFNLFLPLVQKSSVKKVIAISTGLADLDFTNDYDVDIAPLYSASKAALNIIVAKCSAQYKKDGVLFMSISPGVVEVGRNEKATPEELQALMGFATKLASYAPDFKGPITPEESVKHVRSVWEKASIEGGFGGAFVSHLGTKQWV